MVANTILVTTIELVAAVGFGLYFGSFWLGLGVWGILEFINVLIWIKETGGFDGDFGRLLHRKQSK